MKFFLPGVFNDLFQITDVEDDILNCYSHGGPWNHSFCWKSGENIIYAELVPDSDTLSILNQDTIDSGNASNPVCSPQIIAWQKMVNNEYKIFYSTKIFPATEWSDPDTLFYDGDNTDLKMGTVMNFFIDAETISWVNSDTMVVYSVLEDTFLNPLHEATSVCMEPHMFTFDLITDWIGLHIISYSLGENENKEIYAVGQAFMGFPNDPVNLSNNDVPDHNPYLFPGRMGGYWHELINVWESEVNGHRGIYKSDIKLLFGSNDSKKFDENEFQVHVQPNPFIDQTTISFFHDAESATRIDIYNVMGEKVFTKKIIKNNPGWNEYIWKPDLMGLLPEGFYFIQVNQGNLQKTCKAIFKPM
jgi:hypothetical protein